MENPKKLTEDVLKPSSEHSIPSSFSKIISQLSSLAHAHS
jgi:hypothetical protein